jgi:hypothetical protein
MNMYGTRMKQIEERGPRLDRQFVGWPGNPWTPEQMAKAIRQHPQQRVFLRSLLETEVRGQRPEVSDQRPEIGGQRAEDEGRKAEDGDQKAEVRSQSPGNNIVTLDYTPHAAQLEIHRARDKRFRMVCTGRRFGKTLCLAAELLDRGGCEKGGDYGWVAPTYNVAERGIEAFRKFGFGFVQESGRAPCRVEFQGRDGFPRTRIWFLSADNPDNMRGFGFQGLVIDEAATIPANVWNYVLRPTISQTLGWAMLVSTPAGRNWFYDMFTRGMDPLETNYASFTFPSNASPYFPAQEWEEARRVYGERAFRQEYMAEFMEDCAGTFRGIEACLLNAELGMRNAECPRNVVIGCDVAKHKDWTVLIAMDAETGRCFAMDRFNQLDWTIQKERIVGFARQWHGRVIMDATGIGDPIYDDLKRVLPDIEPCLLTVGKKMELIERLRMAVEQRKVSWPGGRVSSEQSAVNSGEWRGLAAGNWEILTDEMKRYEFEIGETGRISYGAPSGYHDDCVIALALANHRKWEGEQCGHMFAIPGGPRRRLRGQDRCVMW